MNKNRRCTNHSGIHKVTRLSKCKTCTHINRTLVLNPLPFTEISTNIHLPTILKPWRLPIIFYSKQSIPASIHTGRGIPSAIRLSEITQFHRLSSDKITCIIKAIKNNKRGMHVCHGILMCSWCRSASTKQVI